MRELTCTLVPRAVVFPCRAAHAHRVRLVTRAVVLPHQPQHVQMSVQSGACTTTASPTGSRTPAPTATPPGARLERPAHKPTRSTGTRWPSPKPAADGPKQCNEVERHGRRASEFTSLAGAATASVLQHARASSARSILLLHPTSILLLHPTCFTEIT